MKIFKLIVGLFFLSQVCLAQNLELQIGPAYNNFDNHLVDSILTDAGQNYKNLSDVDKIVFHKYNAFRAFQLGEQQIVINHFKNLISIDPVYSLDPLTTSPKLLTLFDKSRIEYLEQQQARLKNLSQQNNFIDTPWRSLVFPGWEQWHRGAKAKAYSWATLGSITLVGTIQSLIRTSITHQEYLDEKDPSQVKAKYNTYNDLYKSQYYWAYSLATIWIASHIDAVFFTENKNIEFGLQEFPQNSLMLGIKYKF